MQQYRTILVFLVIAFSCMHAKVDNVFDNEAWSIEFDSDVISGKIDDRADTLSVLQAKEGYDPVKIALCTAIVGGVVVGVAVAGLVDLSEVSSVVVAKVGAAAVGTRTVLLVAAPTVSETYRHVATIKLAWYVGGEVLSIAERRKLIARRPAITMQQKLSALVEEEENDDFESRLEHALKNSCL